MLQAARCGNSSSLTVDIGAARLPQGGRVHHVEDIGAELRCVFAVDMEIFEDRHIQPLIPRTRNLVALAAEIAEHIGQVCARQMQ